MPVPPIGGVQAKDVVPVHSGAFDTRRPGSWNNALVSGLPPAPTRLSRYLVLALTRPKFQLTFGIGRVNTSSSKPVLFTPGRVWPVHSPVRKELSVSAPFRSLLQLLIFSTTKLRPLKVFS